MITLEELIGQYQWRYAVDRFDPEKKLSRSVVESVLECAVLTPSSFGAQPWKIYVVEDVQTKEKMHPYCYRQRQIVDSSHVLVLCGSREYSAKEIDRYEELLLSRIPTEEEKVEWIKKNLTSFVQKKNLEEIQTWSRSQVYILLGFVLASCAALGVDSCPMEGFVSKEIDRILGLKEYTSVLLLALGIRKEDPVTPKIRFDLKQVVSFDSV